MRSTFVLAPIAFLSACAISRPEFVEPKWGNAPAPLPSEVTEITWELRTCSSNCRDEEVVLRRDGRASRAYKTRRKLDSLFVARIDSASFAALADLIVRRGFFAGSDGDGAHEPLATKSLVMSVATLCRRRASAVFVDIPRSITGPQPQTAVDSVARRLSWTRCCRID